MAEIGQDIVKNYLEGLGFEVRKILEGDEKTPDFEVFFKDKLIFYCEEKTVDDFDFEGERNDPTYDSMSARIRKAVKQLKSINPSREVPNVLALVNMDESKNAHDLIITLTGRAPLDNGEYLSIHKVGRLRKDLGEIDLYLWFEKGELVSKVWGEINEEYNKHLKELFQH
jgi:hypothetical protein